MLDRLFVQLLECDSDVMRDIGDPLLFHTICRRLGVKNVAYMGVNLPKKTNREFYVHNTYSKDWAYRYETESYVSIDPIIRLGLNSLMPIDWSNVGQLTKQQSDFFGVAQDHGIGQRGLSFPLRGIHGETAVFSVTADFSPDEWSNFKREKISELRLISDLIHQNVVGDDFKPQKNNKELLTNREVECLRWCSEGRTYQDIADIMGITPRTVKFFLEGARHKLNCLNTTHTVTLALHLRLI